MPSLSFGLLATPLIFSLFPTATALPGRPAPRQGVAFTHSGCFADAADRVLTAGFKGDDHMTVEMCAEHCASFEYFGIEYGRECYCGNEPLAPSLAVPGTECNMPCAGDASQSCGAGWRLDLFTNDGYTPPSPPADPGAPFLGCFVDAGDRVLPDRIISLDDMTAVKCAANCEGYKYFGTQWSRECYCGNKTPTEEAAAYECNMACSGDASEMCGAGMRLSVYGPVGTTTPPDDDHVNPASVDDFFYDGCYTDSVARRVLSAYGIVSSHMSIELCAATCAGYNVFGVEYGTECYCGVELDASSVKSPESDCKMECPGTSSQVCGDVDRLTVYKKDTDEAPPPGPPANPQEVGAFKYQSCWTDAVGTRALSAKDERSTEMTIERCSAFCDGYAFFGVEYADECYCGNELAGGQSSAESDCNMRCSGEPLQWCGGPNRLNLYAVNPITPSPSVPVVPSTTSAAVDATDIPATISTDDPSADGPSTTDAPEATTVVPETSTITPPPDLTTVTSCSTSLLDGQVSCYLSLPAACAGMSTSMPQASAVASRDHCSASLSPMPSALSTCISSGYYFQATSIYSCLQPGVCAMGTACATNTYTVGQEPAPTPPANAVVPNGGFETGNTAGWTFSSPINQPLIIDTTTLRAHNGSAFSLRAVFTNTGQRYSVMERDVPVVPGANYTFSVWLSHDNPRETWTCGLWIGTGPVPYASRSISFRDFPAGQWYQFTFDLTAGASWVRIQAAFSCIGSGPSEWEDAKNTLYFDDFELIGRL